MRKQWVKAKSSLEHCTGNISRDIISILAYVAEIATTFLGIPEFKSNNKSAPEHSDYHVVALFPRKNILRH